MLNELRKRAGKAGQPPGTPVYTGSKKKIVPRVTATSTWINVEGLNNPALIEEISQRYHLHPLTVEDILNVQQRPKIEEFNDYVFITLKILVWNSRRKTFFSEQFSIAFGKNFVLTFQEHETHFFKPLVERMRSSGNQRLRQQSCDYLVYRLIDIIVDQYFVVLEGMGELIESIEEKIISSPTPKNSRTLYGLKRKMLTLRKAIWPMREMSSHLLQTEEAFISPFTRVYFRDVYDHTAQAIDTVETFRDMLAGLLDVYLSSLTNRMNEIMKILTIISTIFIPITFIASVYGMNFEFMPELHWHAGYPMAIGIMFDVTLVMLAFFRSKKWI
jgi:magnesium transporter